MVVESEVLEWSTQEWSTGMEYWSGALVQEWSTGMEYWSEALECSKNIYQEMYTKCTDLAAWSRG